MFSAVLEGKKYVESTDSRKGHSPQMDCYLLCFRTAYGALETDRSWYLVPPHTCQIPLSGRWDQYAWSTPARSHWANLSASGEWMYYPHSVGEKAEALKSFTTPLRPQLWHGRNGTRRLRSWKFALLSKAASPESITLIFSISQSACPKAITQILTERMQSSSREYLHYLVHS